MPAAKKKRVYAPLSLSAARRAFSAFYRNKPRGRKLDLMRTTRPAFIVSDERYLTAPNRYDYPDLDTRNSKVFAYRGYVPKKRKKAPAKKLALVVVKTPAKKTPAKQVLMLRSPKPRAAKKK